MLHRLEVLRSTLPVLSDQAPFLGMANRLGPVSAARSRPCPAKGAGRAADQDLPRGELGSGRVVAITFKATDIAVSARDSNPHGPRPAAQQRGSGPRPVFGIDLCKRLPRTMARPRPLSGRGAPGTIVWRRPVVVPDNDACLSCKVTSKWRCLAERPNRFQENSTPTAAPR